jgi:glycerol-3-phosphate dehydrogenase (NAD(P)+)
MKIAVLGAGVMASALTIPLTDNGHKVNLWGTIFDIKIIETISSTRKHPRLDITMSQSVWPFYVEELEQAMDGCQLILLGVSSIGVKNTVKKIVPFLKDDAIIVTIAKGFELDALGKIMILPDVIDKEMPKRLQSKIPIVAISGPSIAREVVNRVKTNVIFASKNIRAAKLCQMVFTNSNYIVCTSKDIIGTELCASLKNVYAIGIGICDGLNEKRKLDTMNNTKAMLFTFAINEMTKIVKVMGGNIKTVTGLAGLGDLYVTCKGGRNAAFGKLIGSGIDIKKALEKLGTVEGYQTTLYAYKLVQTLVKDKKLDSEKDVPMLMNIYRILYQNQQCEMIENV